MQITIKRSILATYSPLRVCVSPLEVRSLNRNKQDYKRTVGRQSFFDAVYNGV